MKSVRFHDSKLKLVKALLFRLFHETEAPTAGFCSAFICGRAYCTILQLTVDILTTIIVAKALKLTLFSVRSLKTLTPAYSQIFPVTPLFSIF